MIKQKWEIEENERFRILKLHESATKNYYLLSEQTTVTKTSEPQKFKLPNNTFASGEYSDFNKNDVDNIINQMNEYLKKFPINQKVKVEIESSESNVPNRGIKNEKGESMDTGDLSKLRAQTMSNYLKGKLPQNVEIVIKNLGAQGPKWSPPKNATAQQIKQLASSPQYTQYQYVNFNIVGSGQSQEEICDLGFSIIVDYRKEWCKPGVDESKCHKCNQAVFNMWANGIPLTTENGDVNINLNNGVGPDVSGPSVVVKLVVSSEQKKQILSKNPEEILITYNCALDTCHSDPAHITILNDNGQILLPGTFITTGGVRMSKRNPPVKLLKLNKCGNVISTAGQEGMGPEKTTPKPRTPKYRYDGTVNTLYELYKLVGPDGNFVIPQDKVDFFRDYTKFNNQPWKSISDYLMLDNKSLRELKRFAENQSQGQ